MLPDETKLVWEFLKDQPALAGFVLVGGTALALRIHHRRSDDLDFAFSEPRLPGSRLLALHRVAQEAGFNFAPEEDEITVQQFAEAGLDLHNYQQNFIVNSAVRVSFFAPEPPLASVLKGKSESKVRLATLDELFRSKCLVAAVRSKTRDWVDLYLLLRDHGFTIVDFVRAFQDAGSESQCTIALSRMCSGVPQKDDEGYAHLLSNPPSLEEMKDFFVIQRNNLEVRAAEEAMRSRNK